MSCPANATGSTTDNGRGCGHYSTNYPAAEDYDFFFRITKKYKVTNLDEVLIHKEINPGGISLSRRKTQLKSRMKVQIDNFNPLFKESYIGMIKSIILLIIPNRFVLRIKNLANRRQRRNSSVKSSIY